MSKKPGPKESPYEDGESWKTGSSAKKERMELYLQWLLTPDSEREPRFKKDFASLLGVDDSTLWRYEQDFWFQREFQRRKRGLFKVSDAEKVIKAQIEIATDPSLKQASTQAARFLFEWMDKMDVKQDQDSVLENYSKEELIEFLEGYVESETD